MNARIFARFRRSRARMGSVVLTLFVAACLTSSAVPCFAMAAAGAAVGHSHSATQHASPAPTAHHEHGHSHAHDEQAPPAAPKHCPHCPPGAPSPDHAAALHDLCSAVDDAASSATASSAAVPLKHAVPVTVVDLVPPVRHLPAHSFLARHTARTYSHVPLILRHCVLLI